MIINFVFLEIKLLKYVGTLPSCGDGISCVWSVAASALTFSVFVFVLKGKQERPNIGVSNIDYLALLLYRIQDIAE